MISSQGSTSPPHSSGKCSKRSHKAHKHATIRTASSTPAARVCSVDLSHGEVPQAGQGAEFPSCKSFLMKSAPAAELSSAEPSQRSGQSSGVLLKIRPRTDPCCPLPLVTTSEGPGQNQHPPPCTPLQKQTHRIHPHAVRGSGDRLCLESCGHAGWPTLVGRDFDLLLVCQVRAHTITCACTHNFIRDTLVRALPCFVRALLLSSTKSVFVSLQGWK